MKILMVLILMKKLMIMKMKINLFIGYFHLIYPKDDNMKNIVDIDIEKNNK